MTFNRISFNEKFWADKTESEFVKHEAHHGLTDEQLKEAFALMQPAKPVEKVLEKPVKKGGDK